MYARRQGIASTRSAIYYSICPESVVLSNANMAWEVIAVIIFQGLGTGESTKVRCENRNGDDNETNARRPVVGAVKYQRTRESSRRVNCMLKKDLHEGELIHRECTISLFVENWLRVVTSHRREVARRVVFSAYSS